MKNKLKIAIVGTAGVPACYGGFETLAENLLNYQDDYHIQYYVYCSSKSYQKKRTTHKGAVLKYIPLQANGVQSILYDIISIIHALFVVDKILILGTSGCLLLPFIRLFSRKPVFINIDGLEHQRGKWGKMARKFLKFSEKMAVRYAHTVIVDNKAIQSYVKEEYGKNTVLIAYGGDHVLDGNDDAVLSKFELKKKDYAFSVCRIEPENNIHLMLEAFSQVPSIKVVMVGNWRKNNYGKTLYQEYSTYKNIYMIEAIYDIKKLNGFRKNCRYYVHGHSAGGTNPSLVEAMNLELPVIAFDVIYNRETTESKAYYFDSSASLINIITHISEEALQQNALNMKEIAIQHYQWHGIAKKYINLFAF